MKINEGNYGEKLYKVTLGTGLAWTQSYEVYAYNESDAVDLVADYCEEHEFHGLYSGFYDLYDECDVGQSVDEYAEANGLTCCGNSGIYMQILGITEVQE
jgi:hypothetical protein